MDALAREGVSHESFYLMIALLYLDVITQFGFSFLVSCLWPACQYIPRTAKLLLVIITI